MYCKYLDKTKYEVHYVGFHKGLPDRTLDDVVVHHIQMSNNRWNRYFLYIKQINKIIRKEKFDLLFLVDCKGSLFIRLFNMHIPSVMDVRTGDIHLGKKWISVLNLRILFSTLFFQHITVLSENLRKLLHLPGRKCTVIPLGADILNRSDKKFDNLFLFYVGGLQERNITQTIEGLSLFAERNPEISFEYNIVAYGNDESVKALLKVIEKTELTGKVRYHGRKNHDEIAEIFNKSNIGVVYVPITRGYTCQPTTKLYEYVLSGMSVIATKTKENEKDVLPLAGVLVEDNPEAFSRGLEEICKIKHLYSSDQIRQQYMHFQWEEIVGKNLEPLLDKL